jgi:ribonuclease HI
VGLSGNQAIMLYKLLIRSLMDYGSALWAGYGEQLIKPLQQIQRRALLAASGAMKTTSLQALEVDCHVLPLDLRLSTNALRWYARICVMPAQHPLHKQIRELHGARPPPRSFLHYVSCLSNLQRTGLLRLQRLCRPEPAQFDYDDPNIPWRQVLSDQDTDVLDSLTDSGTRLLNPFRHRISLDSCPTLPKRRDAEAKTMACQWVDHMLYSIRCNNDGLTAVCFTDASASAQHDQQAFASSSAVVELLNAQNGTQRTSAVAEVISPCCNNNSAELFAIGMACARVRALTKTSSSPATTVHIFSDSLYSINVLTERYQPSAATSLDALHWTVFQLFMLLLQGSLIVLHWIPGHCGIPGNEAADSAARDALEHADQLLPEHALIRVPLHTWTSTIRTHIDAEWQRRWDTARNWTDFPTGSHFHAIKATVSKIPLL